MQPDRAPPGIDQALGAGNPSTCIVPVFQTFEQVCTSSGRNYASLLLIAHGGRDGSHAAIRDEKVLLKDRPFNRHVRGENSRPLVCPVLPMADGGSHPTCARSTRIISHV